MPYLAPTSIKGMLRAAYEAITNSRMGIFHGHNDRLAYRMEAREGLKVVPARIEKNTAGQLCIRLLPGNAPINADGTPNGSMYAAWLRVYGRQHGNNWGALAQHGAPVWAYITLWRHSNPSFEFWNVVELRGGNGPQPVGHTPPENRNNWFRARPANPPQGHWVRGYVCITRQNIDRKHDERVFFVAANHPQQGQLVVSLSNELCKAWQELITNYQELHRDEISRGRTGPPALQRSVWSRHIVGGALERELVEGTLCYARVQDHNGHLQIMKLYPVMISRELFVQPPWLDPALHPSVSLQVLSPADRVFGWVSQESTGTYGTSAYRGNLRVGSATCVEWPGKAQGEKPLEEFQGRGIPLGILGQPKPQQARFYAARDAEGAPLGQDGQAPPKKEDGYVQGHSLRGRKVYPHHAGLSADYWKEPTADRTQTRGEDRFFQEYRRPHKGEKKMVRDDSGREREEPVKTSDGTFQLLQGEANEQRDDQNRSVTAWVKCEAAFTFDIHISNLSDVELGALLWLLSLRAGHLHRLGGGKPLGFGSVQLEITGLELRDGDAWAAWYSSLITPATRGRSVQDMTDAPFISCVRDFKKAVENAYGNGHAFDTIPLVQAFLRSCQGFTDGLPVHYPRLSASPDPEGENFKWFGENERRSRVSLGALHSPDPGLPRW
jgi:CRISPR-associated protein (TIGR03986 family)